MTLLCELAQKYGTDKFPWYTPFYHLLLDRRREYVHSVLEIGIGTPEAMKHVPDYKPGASLRMWEEYFPHAMIFGVDKESGLMATTDRTRVSRCDQSNPEDLRRAAAWVQCVGPGKPNLIVDDGSHDPHHQISTFNALFPLLAEGGLYIIEDVNGPLFLDAPCPTQTVECHAPGSPYIGRLIMAVK